MSKEVKVEGGYATETTLAVIATGATTSAEAVHAEDVAHVSGDKGVLLLGVRADSAAATGANGDYVPLLTDADGKLWTNSLLTEVATAADGGALPALTKVVSGYDGSNVQALHTDAAGDVQVDVLSSALPTGAATESTLSTLDGKVVACNTGAVTVSASALPTGAATEATLSALEAKVTACNTGAVTVASSALPAGAATESTLSTLNGKVTACNTGSVTVASSALPAGAATEATLSAASAKLPATLGQKAMAASMSVAIASNQSAIPSYLVNWDGNLQQPSFDISGDGKAFANSDPAQSVAAFGYYFNGTNYDRARGDATNGAYVNVKALVALPTGTNSIGKVTVNANASGEFDTTGEGGISSATTETVPSGAIGFILCALDTNTANIRWKIGAAASASSGIQMQPGRDTGYVPCAADISVCPESGTQYYSLQWIKA